LTFDEAVKDKKWKMAIYEDMQTLTNNKTWILVPRKDVLNQLDANGYIRYNYDIQS
jgi:hypothetical protein